MSEVRIVTLTPDRVETFTGFFDGDIFADKPDWASCYCHAFYFDRSTGAHWSTRTAAENRAASCGMISEGRMSGLFAVVEDRVVGWCNAARKSDMTAFADDPTPGFDNDQVVFMSCFMVAPSARGQGVARALLRGAEGWGRSLGMSLIEGNPRPKANTPGANHFGPLELFLSEGYAIDREGRWDSVYVRKLL